MASKSSPAGRPPGRRSPRPGGPRGGGSPRGGGEPSGGAGRARPAGSGGARSTGCDDVRPGGPDLGESNIHLIYGRNPVREALRGRRRVHEVVLVAGGVGDELERRLDEWFRDGEGESAAPVGPSALPLPRPCLRRLPAVALSELVGTNDHQGIAARVDPYPYVDLKTALGAHTLLIALDEIQDPHNLGAIIRTAEGAGAAVVIPRHRAADVTAAVVKASAGATEHVTVSRVRNLADALAEIKAVGFWIYGAAAEAGGLYTAQDYRYPTCFVMGSEGEGLGRRVASMCDVMVALPLAGRMGSLNVSVSSGVLLYEAVRQRGEAASTATLSAGVGEGTPSGSAPSGAGRSAAGEGRGAKGGRRS